MLHRRLAALKPSVAEANTATSLAPDARASLRPCGWREGALSGKSGDHVDVHVDHFLTLMFGVSTGNRVRPVGEMLAMTSRASASWHPGQAVCEWRGR